MSAESPALVSREFVMDSEAQLQFGIYANHLYMESAMVVQLARGAVKTPVVLESFQAVQDEAERTYTILREAGTMMLVGEDLLVEPVTVEGGGADLQLRTKTWMGQGLIKEHLFLAGLESNENLKKGVEEALATGATVKISPKLSNA